MAVLIDIDGVVADSHKVLIDRLRNDGYDVSVEDITAWSFGRLRDKTGLSTKDCIEAIWDVWRTQPNDIPPLDGGVVDTVNKILATYDSGIVTANPVPTVRDWLAHVGIRTEHFLHAEQKTDLAYTILIEDNPTLELNGHTLLLRDRPWNRHLTDRVSRFFHSTELLPMLAALYTQGRVSYR